MSRDLNFCTIFIMVEPFIAIALPSSVLMHNEVKRGKNSNFKCVVSRLLLRLKSTFFEIFSSGLDGSTRKNFKKKIFGP